MGFNSGFKGLKWSSLPLKNVSSQIAHLRQHCHNSKSVIFPERLLKVLKCYSFLCVQRRQSSSPAASCANCVMTLFLLKVHLQTFLSLPVTQKCQILSCDTLVANGRNENSSLLGVWHCVTDWIFPNIFKDYCTFIFRVKQSKDSGLHALEEEGAMVLHNTGTYSPNNRVAHPRRPESSVTPLREISQGKNCFVCVCIYIYMYI